MDKVKLGIIGIGNMGSPHSLNIIKGMTPEIELTAVADRSGKRQAWIKQNLPDSVHMFTDGEELLESGLCDAVLIATPHYSHPELTMKALGRGLHVLCEKPVGVYTQNIREVNEAARKSGLVFALMFNHRTNDINRKMKELVESGELGAIKRVNMIVTYQYRSQSYYNSGGWRATWDGEGGGVLLNQTPHSLDVMQWICGMPVRIRAFCHNGKWHDIEVEDDVTAYFEYANGATGVFIASTGDAPGTYRLEITLEMGKLVSENDKLILYKLEQNEREYCKTSLSGFESPKTEVIEVETDGKYEQHVGIMNAFAGKILRGTPLVAEGTEGINSLTISNAMHLSSWLDKTVEIPFDEDMFLSELNKRRALSKKKEVTEITFNIHGNE